MSIKKRKCYPSSMSQNRAQRQHNSAMKATQNKAVFCEKYHKHLVRVKMQYIMLSVSSFLLAEVTKPHVCCK